MFSKFIHPYFYIFYFCGQSPFNPIKKSPHIMSTIAFTFSGVIFVTSILAIFSQYYLAPYFGVTDAFLAILFIASELVTTLTVYFQNQFFGTNLKSLWLKLMIIEKQLCQSMEDPVNSAVFNKMYRPRFVLNIGLLIAHFTVKYSYPSKYTHITVQSCVLTLQIFSLLANLHMLFYITVFEYFLCSMIRQVRQMFHSGNIDSAHNKVNHLTGSLTQCKMVYLKLWDAVQIVNNHFGWSLAALCIQNFFDVTYALYWIFMYLHADDIYLIIRKYTIVLHKCFSRTVL